MVVRTTCLAVATDGGGGVNETSTITTAAQQLQPSSLSNSADATVQSSQYSLPQLIKKKRLRTDTTSTEDDDHAVLESTRPQHQKPPPLPPTKKLFSIFHVNSKRPNPIKSSLQLRHHSTTTGSSNTTGTISTTPRTSGTGSTTIYVDLDGVLVDFDHGVHELQTIYEQSKNPNKPLKFNMWSSIQRRRHFYRTLPWTHDGKELWTYLCNVTQQHQPQQLHLHILTGVPWNSSTAAMDKFHWCQRELQQQSPGTLLQATTTTIVPKLIRRENNSNHYEDENSDGQLLVASASTTPTTVESTTTTISSSSSGSDISEKITKRTTTTATTDVVIPAVPSFNTTMESQLAQQNSRQWYWKNMAGPKKTHQRMNLASTTITPERIETVQRKAAAAAAAAVTARMYRNNRMNRQDDATDSNSNANVTGPPDPADTKVTADTTTTTTATNPPKTATIPPATTTEYRPLVITCWSINKHHECRSPGDILIDDRPDNHQLRHKWEQAGGIFIHHTDTSNTIQQLQQYLHPLLPIGTSTVGTTGQEQHGHES